VIVLIPTSSADYFWI